VTVNGSQIEIDGGYEGSKCLAIVEAKNKISEDFNTRQLYYPFRRFEKTMRSKRVRNIYQVFSDGIFNLYEYEFSDVEDFTTIRLVKSQRYSLDSEIITLEELEVLAHNPPLAPPGAGFPTFPQADKFTRLVNLCEFITAQGSVSKQDIYIENDFDPRQASYYTAAGCYLGLLEVKDSEVTLTPCGRQVMGLKSSKERKLAFAGLIFVDDIFRQLFLDYLKLQTLPSESRALTLMMNANLISARGEPLGDNTLRRRTKTALGWIRWVINLIGN
ncbi:MAG: hypothetical protein SOW59_06165, partial [Corynebacterium sp.]|nr:hypothetical protein [Corynebacterium sp.]